MLNRMNITGIALLIGQCAQYNVTASLCFQRTIDVVKIDIEMAEWPVIRDIIVSGEFRYIKMLIIEIHTPQQKVPLIVEEYLQVSGPCLKR